MVKLLVGVGELLAVAAVEPGVVVAGLAGLDDGDVQVAAAQALPKSMSSSVRTEQS